MFSLLEEKNFEPYSFAQKLITAIFTIFDKYRISDWILAFVSFMIWKKKKNRQRLEDNSIQFISTTIWLEVCLFIYFKETEVDPIIYGILDLDLFFFFLIMFLS